MHNNMFLAIDIGNSHSVLGLFKTTELVAEIRLSSDFSISRDLMENMLLSAFDQHKIAIDQIQGVAISSVVPPLTTFYAEFSQKHLSHKALVINSALDLGIRLHYDHPQSLGVDRICSAVAGFAKYGGPLIIIDMGTATTFNVIAANGDFLGGIITAGIGTMATSLNTRTAQLPQIDLKIPEKVICTNTTSAIQAGILLGSIDAIDGLLQRLKLELSEHEKEEPHIIITGGFSSMVGKHLSTTYYHEPTLVLNGIRLIGERVRRASNN
jgi:type III pantothenate kinase